MPSTPSDTPRRRRQSKACGRCRKRKIRCDFQYPTCGACSAAGARCLGFDTADGSDKPRSIVRHLEEQVANLELDLAAVKSQNSSVLDNVEAAVETLSTAVAAAAADPTWPGRKQEQLVPLASKYFLSDSSLPLFDHGAWDSSSVEPEAEQSWRAMTISSIPRHIVEAMLRHYCETYRPQYPSIEESDLYSARERVYDNPQLIGYDAFVICITLAISSNTLMHIDEKRAASTTYGLWTTAVSHLEQVGLSSSWERLQALQLLTHYGFLNPQHVNVSRCSGAASRLALQLGLHEELPFREQAKLEPSVLNTRRRMFWNAYGMDAAAHSVCCQPFRWLRPDITAKFPDSESQATPTHSAHMWSLRAIECDVIIGLYYPTLAQETGSDVTSPVDPCYTDIQARVEAWYQAVRQSVNLTERIEFHEVLYQIQVLRLNKPSPRFPTPTKEMRQKAIRAAITLIKEFNVFERLGKMFMLWHAAHCVVEAGVYLLWTILVGIESQSQDRRHLAGEDITILMRYVKIFPSLVVKISRRWPSVKAIATTLESVATVVTGSFQAWSEGRDVATEDIVLMKEKLGHRNLFVATPASQGHTVSSLPLPARAGQLQEPAQIQQQSSGQSEAAVFDPPAYAIDAAPPNPGWVGAQSGLDNGFPLFPESYTIDYGDPMTWGFPGIDSEEIFAALLVGGQTDSEMLQ